jgi:hypothetical protein
VTFRTKDGRSTTLHPHEFLGRWLLHVLPCGFVMIRHAGLFTPRQVATALPIAQQLLAQRPPPVSTPPSWLTLVQRLTGIDLTVCPRCHQRTLARRLLPRQPERAPR